MGTFLKSFDMPGVCVTLNGRAESAKCGNIFRPRLLHILHTDFSAILVRTTYPPPRELHAHGVKISRDGADARNNFTILLQFRLECGWHR